jgi:hypothetical protein
MLIYRPLNVFAHKFRGVIHTRSQRGKNVR